MQVIMLQDVPKVGHKYDVVEVANGYASNFLFPRKLALQATKEKVASLAKEREAHKAEQAAKVEALQSAVTGIAGEKLVLTMKADDKGHLFKKVRAEDVAALLADKHNVSVPETAILIDEPFHELGEHTFTVAVGENKTELTLAIEKEI